MDQGGEDAGPGGPQGVAQGDGAAVGVEPLVLHGKAPLPEDGESLRGEGLVELNEAEVREAQPRPLQGFPGGGHGADPHDPWGYAGHGDGADTG